MFFVLLVMAGIIPPQSLMAQRDKVDNLPKFDQRKIHFGFALGINTADFVIEHDLSVNDSLISLEAKRQSGFNLGIISDLHLGPFFDLRFTPTLSFGQRNLEYSFRQPDNTISVVVKPIESTWVDFPIGIKYRSARLNNFAAYMVTGFKYSLDLASQEKVNNEFNDENEIIVKLRKHNYAYEIGFGMDFFLEYFKFSPELKLSVGLNDIRVNDGSEFSDPISRLNSKIWLISFNFEG